MAEMLAHQANWRMGTNTAMTITGTSLSAIYPLMMQDRFFIKNSFERPLNRIKYTEIRKLPL